MAQISDILDGKKSKMVKCHAVKQLGPTNYIITDISSTTVILETENEEKISVGFELRLMKPKKMSDNLIYSESVMMNKKIKLETQPDKLLIENLEKKWKMEKGGTTFRKISQTISVQPTGKAFNQEMSSRIPFKNITQERIIDYEDYRKWQEKQKQENQIENFLKSVRHEENLDLNEFILSTPKMLSNIHKEDDQI